MTVDGQLVTQNTFVWAFVNEEETEAGFIFGEAVPYDDHFRMAGIKVTVIRNDIVDDKYDVLLLLEGETVHDGRTISCKGEFCSTPEGGIMLRLNLNKR